MGQSNERGDGGIYIGSIMKGGAVAADGRIEPGDMLLQVGNGRTDWPPGGWRDKWMDGWMASWPLKEQTCCFGAKIIAVYCLFFTVLYYLFFTRL